MPKANSLTITVFSVALVATSVLIGTQLAYYYRPASTVTAITSVTVTMTLDNGTTVSTNSRLFPLLYMFTENCSTNSPSLGGGYLMLPGPCFTVNPLDAQTFNCIAAARQPNGCVIQIVNATNPNVDYNLTVRFVTFTGPIPTGLNCNYDAVYFSREYINQTNIGAYCQQTNSTAFVVVVPSPASPNRYGGVSESGT
jgi:hypothetical protein